MWHLSIFITGKTPISDRVGVTRILMLNRLWAASEVWEAVEGKGVTVSGEQDAKVFVVLVGLLLNFLPYIGVSV